MWALRIPSNFKISMAKSFSNRKKLDKPDTIKSVEEELTTSPATQPGLCI
jgi:hypothetical protein